MNPNRSVYVDSLDDAYRQGYFSGSVSRRKFREAFEKKNKYLRFIYNKYGVGLYDTMKGKYVSPIGKVNPIPKYTLQDRRTHKILAKGWFSIVKSLRRQGYEIDL